MRATYIQGLATAAGLIACNAQYVDVGTWLNSGGRGGDAALATTATSPSLSGLGTGGAPPASTTTPRSSTGASSMSALVAQSCVGLPEDCGPTADESCCAGATVPGGAFTMSDPYVTGSSSTVVVSAFWLNRFEVTVGRFRAFVDAYPGSKPKPGDGANSRILGSGWDASWPLPADRASLETTIRCSSGSPTWTSTPGAQETSAINCVYWYTAFAFCAWDGGRLPTEAEWNYAASGRSDQRVFPWPSATVTSALAVFANSGTTAVASVGSRSPEGDGRWEQADLAGNVAEWVLDWYVSPYAPTCHDCAVVSKGVATTRGVRGGGWEDISSLLSSCRVDRDPATRSEDYGVRCARSL